MIFVLTRASFIIVAHVWVILLLVLVVHLVIGAGRVLPKLDSPLEVRVLRLLVKLVLIIACDSFIAQHVVARSLVWHRGGLALGTRRCCLPLAIGMAQCNIGKARLSLGCLAWRMLVATSLLVVACSRKVMILSVTLLSAATSILVLSYIVDVLLATDDNIRAPMLIIEVTALVRHTLIMIVFAI